MISDEEYLRVLDACKKVPSAKTSYIDNDYVTALFRTVLDFMMHVEVVEKSVSYYKTNLWDKIRSFDDLKLLPLEIPK